MIFDGKKHRNTMSTREDFCLLYFCIVWGFNCIAYTYSKWSFISFVLCLALILIDITFQFWNPRYSLTNLQYYIYAIRPRQVTPPSPKQNKKQPEHFVFRYQAYNSARQSTVSCRKDWTVITVSKPLEYQINNQVTSIETPSMLPYLT